MNKPRTFRLALVACLIVLGLWPILVFRRLLGNRIFFAAVSFPVLMTLPSIVNLFITAPYAVPVLLGSVVTEVVSLPNVSNPPDWVTNMMSHNSWWEIEGLMLLVGVSNVVIVTAVDYWLGKKLMKKLRALIPQLTPSLNNTGVLNF